VSVEVEVPEEVTKKNTMKYKTGDMMILVGDKHNAKSPKDRIVLIPEGMDFPSFQSTGGWIQADEVIHFTLVDALTQIRKISSSVYSRKYTIAGYPFHAQPGSGGSFHWALNGERVESLLLKYGISEGLVQYIESEIE
jgi:hypothetical protein